MGNEKRPTITSTAVNVISDAKKRIISASVSLSDLMNSAGNFKFTKSLRKIGNEETESEEWSHSSGDRSLIEKKNDLYRKMNYQIIENNMDINQAEPNPNSQCGPLRTSTPNQGNENGFAISCAEVTTKKNSDSNFMLNKLQKSRFCEHF
jgi:hypothetical protein